MGRKRSAPLPPVCGVEKGRVAGRLVAGDIGGDGVAGGEVVTPVRPRLGKEHSYASRGDDDSRGDFNDERAPGASMPFAQRIVFPALAPVSPLLMQ